MRVQIRRALSLGLSAAMALQLCAVAPASAEEQAEPSVQIQAGEQTETLSAALKGAGTQEDPYLIASQTDLQAAIEAINAGGDAAGAWYQLTDDITLEGSIPSIETFSGTLDGAGHVIRDYTLSSGDETDALVRVNEGTIQNLALTGVKVTGPNTAETSRRGGLCFQNYGTIQQCYVQGSVSGGHRSGGIVAENYNTIQNCYFLGDVTGRCESGGITAWNQNTGRVINCYVQGNIATQTNNSGIIGGYGYTGTVYQGNVVLSGSTLSSVNDWNHARICGRNNGETTFRDNLCCNDVTVNGETVSDGAADNLQGLDQTADELQQQETYEAIGWDFETVWVMDEALGRPALRSCREAIPEEKPDRASYQVESPDGDLVATVYVDGQGQLGYSVTLHGVQVLERATLGLTVDGVELGKDAVLGAPVETTFDETYATRGMHTQARNHYNQSAFPVASGEAAMTLNVRAYDDGVAIQYDLPEGEHTISGDDTRFALPTDATAFYQYGDGTNYEGIKNMQVPTETSQVSAIGVGRLLCTLPTFELKDKAAYVSLTEANLYDWSGMGLRTEGSGVLKAEYWDESGKTFTTSEDSPWRVAIIADNLNDFANSDMVTNVSDPLDESLFAGDTSWIQPGRSVWTTQGGGPSTIAGYKEYSDYASQLGIEFNLIEGRDDFGATLDEQFAAIKEIADYSAALENPVKIWLWEDAPTTRYEGGLYVEANARDFLQRCQDAGVVGVKIDHIHSEAPDKVSFYEDFTRLAAEYHIMVSYHNPMKPTGLSRTYPNEMTREAIRGMQYQCNPNENAILPFTRLLAGSADYTPLNFTNSSKLGSASWTHMLANTVIMTSSYLQLSENPKNMVGQVYTEFIEKLPAVWDETIVLDQSEIGEAAAFLRRSGDDWYLAVQNSAHGEKEMTFALSFLGEGDWYADIYYDNLNSAAQIRRRVEKVTSADELTAQIRSGGGYVVRLTQEEVVYESDADKTFTIDSVGDLDLIREHPDATFNLTADLELTGEFEPITILNGTLNGNGHTISGFTFTDMDASAAFILQNNGTIRQLGLTNVYLEGPYTSDNSWRAALCVRNYGIIEECYALGTVTGGHRNGGLVSENYNTIRNCYFMGDLESNYETGGITSWNHNASATVEHCYAAGNYVSHHNNIGFISGYAYNGTRMTGNVALSGTLSANQNTARICGRNNGVDEATTYQNNLACAEITVNGSTVTGGAANNKNGQDKTADELKQQATYEAIGWDFENVWTMSEEGRPELKNVPEVPMDENEPAVVQNSISLAPGSNETEMNLTWYANTDGAGTLLWAKESALSDGQMPEDAQSVQAAGQSANKTGYWSYQATMTGLEGGVRYAYQVVNGEKESPIYTFTTDDTSDGFTFLFMGDPQLGAGGDLNSDESGWAATLSDAAQRVSDAAFLLSAGDQVNTADNESQYSAYLEHEELRQLPVATVVGNHDSSSSSYDQHFNVANQSAYGATNASSDYWFRYGNALFLVLNVNNMSAAEHKAFLEEAIRQNPDAEWKIVAMHHSVYSVANHAVEGDILQRREELVPIFEELDIDVVLQGHDHVYVRTYMMDGFNPVTDPAEYDNAEMTSVTDTDDILYVTANSASGSKYYEIQNMAFPYAAVKNQEHVPTYSKVTVTGTEFTITTYRVSSGSVVDTFTIRRTAQEEPAEKDVSVAVQGAGVAGQDQRVPYAVTFSGDQEGLANVTVIFRVSGDQAGLFTTDALEPAEGVQVLAVEKTDVSDTVRRVEVTLAYKLGEESAAGSAENEPLFTYVLRTGAEVQGRIQVELEKAIFTYDLDPNDYNAQLGGAAATQVTGELYDVNGDGRFTQADITAVQHYYQVRQGESTWEEAQRGDFDGSGVIDLEDLIIIAKAWLAVQ